ncbi:uncharacterized protein LOC125680915 isoform X2 [Ostrea edulis]|uniref:uncharacterized protein LOC125680915 isoform X2 n=1 Tax=Ostrea edulis TaxID=37623 RepID=UPI0024AECFC5|nr:uncharacterized protein LOC125680915 isoform X2 [Ostrea edulis]
MPRLRNKTKDQILRADTKRKAQKVVDDDKHNNEKPCSSQVASTATQSTTSPCLDSSDKFTVCRFPSPSTFEYATIECFCTPPSYTIPKRNEGTTNTAFPTPRKNISERRQLKNIQQQTEK